MAVSDLFMSWQTRPLLLKTGMTTKTFKAVVWAAGLACLQSCSMTGVSANGQTTPNSILTPPILSEACEVSLALSAAPDYLRGGASVYVLRTSGYELIKQGTNPFTCIVNRDDPRVLKPTCLDAEGTATVIPKIRYFGSQILQGRNVSDINSDIESKFETGEFISQRRPGVAYMLSRYNRPVNSETGELGFFPPHIMFHAPNLTDSDIGHDMDHFDPERPPHPFIAYGGPQGYMIMISDDGAPRRRSDLDPSCPDWIWD